MNYLAHAYLSFGHSSLLIGNMISDFVKGKKKLLYPESIQLGIQLHREIDEFTDNHPVTKESKQYFKPDYGLYGGAFIDIVYDHFLATDLSRFTTHSLRLFSIETYQNLDEQFHLLPANFALMLPYMKEHNWLYNYQYTWGIEKSFEGLVRRATYMYDSKPAYQIFQAEYDTLQKLYQQFFPELEAFALENIRSKGIVLTTSI